MRHKKSERKKILWGICGVGMGHAYRQMPIIEHLAKHNDIAIITYGNPYDVYSQKFKNSANVKVLHATPPYLPDGPKGIGFREAIDLPRNQNIDFFRVSASVFAKLDEVIGSPNLVIGDYEPMCAQYGYAHNAPVITLDQQSKYLSGDFPEQINGLSYLGEVMRLQLFYPKAKKRIACSFFNHQARENSHQVTIVPPIIRQEVRSIEPHRKDDGSIIVYLSEYPDITNAIEQLRVTAVRTKTRIKIFAKGIKAHNKGVDPLISFHEPDKKTFLRALATCSGIICTAGHSLLSEAMYLGIPVYALPRQQYEALLCSQIISENKFGVSSQNLTEAALIKFIHDIPNYQLNIRLDSNNALLREDGTKQVIRLISAYL